MRSAIGKAKSAGSIPATALLVVVLVSACSSTMPGEETKPLILAEGGYTMEPIGNSSFDGKWLRFQAVSNGCTRSEHFSVSHTIKGNQCELTVVRNQPDNCRMASHLRNYSVPWTLPESCSGLDVIVMNPEVGSPTKPFEERLPE